MALVDDSTTRYTYSSTTTTKKDTYARARVWGPSISCGANWTSHTELELSTPIQTEGTRHTST